MQPPTMTAYTRSLRSILESLKVESEQCTPTEVNKARCDAGSTQAFVADISAWVATLSPKQQARRYAITEIVILAELTGKHGGNPSHTRTAHALRLAGFQSKRDWTVAGRNTRYWKLSGEM